ncbi:MAG TPA: family 2A encapsulin nanocompartment cargo protein cysteine desulfurase [Thermodesulfobacteriota bacterium]|nr:family 2A encapsulin nanocompartment cargo protein cysteine desulfurase [Thermodesulfobacteriota bacterium]
MTKKNKDDKVDIPNAVPSLQNGLPDPAALARMAGEFFTEFQTAAGGYAAQYGTGIEEGIAGTGLFEDKLREIPLSLYDDVDLVYAESASIKQPGEPPGINYSGPGVRLPRQSSSYTPDRDIPRGDLLRNQERTLYGFIDGVNFLELPGKDFGRYDTGLIPEMLASSDPRISGFDVNAIRKDFPILSTYVNGRKLIWLDNAATTQKPHAVIDRLSFFYENENSNVHRGAHTLAARSTDAYEAAREKVRRLLNASSANEIIFVRGATEGINLVARSYGQRLQRDDEIIITWLEHHANIVPWQMVCAETGARLRVVPVDESGQVLMNEYTKLLNHRTRIVSLPHVSNALGTITPVAEITALAHRYGARVLVDGAQAVSHIPVDVQTLDCDFYVFSGHKIFGPTGIGAVYGKSDVLETMPPWQGGGSMIRDVTFERTVYQSPPARFEAGTGNIADAVGLGAAIDYVTRIGLHNISLYEHELLDYATEALRSIEGLRLIGTAKEKASVLSFVLEGYSSEEVGEALSREGIAVRAGHHCAQPILRRYGLESTVRPSLAFYNTCEEIDILADAIRNLSAGRPSGIY